MFDVFKNRLELTGTLTTITALRISQGRSTEPIGSDLPVVKDALGQPLIPGSSFKGAMRSRLESFLRGVFGNDRKLIANPTIEAEWSLKSEEIKILKSLNFDELVIWHWAIEKTDFPVSTFSELSNLIFLIRREKSGRKEIRPEERNLLQRLPDKNQIETLKKSYESIDAALTKAIVRETDIASLVFGSPWISSKFQVRDLTVKPDSWFGQYQERDGVSIDRDTETAVDGRLYDFQVVPAGVEFDFRAVFENAEAAQTPQGESGYWELGLVMIGLEQFKRQQIPLGGGNSRGLGVVELAIEDFTWVDPEGDPAKLLEYMRNLASGNLTPYQRDMSHVEALTAEWTRDLVNYLSAVMPVAETAPV